MTKRAPTSPPKAGERPSLSKLKQDPADDPLCEIIRAELAERFEGKVVCREDVATVIREMTGCTNVDVKFFELACGGSRCEVLFK